MSQTREDVYLALVNQGWQPMTTAPRDGSHVLLAVEGRDHSCIGSWNGGQSRWEFLDLGYSSRFGGSATNGFVLGWMPMPKPPKAKVTE